MSEDRSKFIGGSDIAAVLGLSRWSSPLQIWAEKTGLVPADDISKNIPVRVGVKLEDTVCELFEEATGKSLSRSEGRKIHPQYPFLVASLDREVVGEHAIFEAKTASAFKMREWDDGEIPQEYILQVLWYLGITGAEYGYIGALIGNSSFTWKRVERDEQTIRTMIQRAIEFWEKFVIPKVPPAPTAIDREVLGRLYPIADEKTVKLGDDAARIIESLEGMERDAKALDAQIERSRNELRAMLKEAERGETDAHIVTWSNTTVRRIDTEAFKKELPDLYERFRKPTTTRRFLVRQKSQDKGE